MQNLKLGYASWARSHDRWSPVADVDRSAMARLVVMYVRKARAVLIAIAEPMPRPRCVGRAAERPRCSTTSCEKESEVRSENDSEEEETYLVVARPERDVNGARKVAGSSPTALDSRLPSVEDNEYDPVFGQYSRVAEHRMKFTL